jgi:hypothetical protein
MSTRMLFNVDEDVVQYRDDVKVRCNSGWARGGLGSNGAEPQTPDSCRVDGGLGEGMDDRCGHIDQEREPFKPDLAFVHLSKRAGPLPSAASHVNPACIRRGQGPRQDADKQHCPASGPNPCSAEGEASSGQATCSERCSLIRKGAGYLHCTDVPRPRRRPCRFGRLAARMHNLAASPEIRRVVAARLKAYTR